MTGEQRNVQDVELNLLPENDTSEDQLKEQYQQRLLDALERNDIDGFNLLLVSRYVDVDRVVDNATCLSVAIARGHLHFVNSVLLAGADCNKVVDGLTPLQSAIKWRRMPIVERLLRESAVNVNLFRGGGRQTGALDTPLIFLAKQAAADGAPSADDQFSFECAKELLLCEAEPNVKDRDGKTAIVIAVESGRRDVVRAILDYSQLNVDIDRLRLDTGRTVREAINDGKLYTREISPPVEQTESVTALFRFLRKNQLDEFVQSLQRTKNKCGRDFDARYYGLLRFAIKNVQERAVDELLKHKIDDGLLVRDNKKQLIDRACWRGNVNVLANLLRSFEIDTDVLSAVALKYIKSDCEGRADIRECVNALLQDARMPLNEQDGEGNTILHHVIQRMDDAAVRLCLRNGASVAIKNRLNEFLVANVDARLFEEHLDACVSSTSVRGVDVIALDFRCLEPFESHDLRYEMDLLRYMEKDEERRPLLKHPLLETFVVVKCRRMNFVFHTYLLCYLLFCCVLFVNSYLDFEPDRVDAGVISGFHYALLAFTALLLAVEITQLHDVRHYVSNFENGLDVVVIACCALVLSRDSRTEYFALANVLAVLRLIFHLAKFPYVSTYVSMFKTVSLNFIKFVLCSFVLLFTFSWSFVLTLRDDDDDDGRDGRDGRDGTACCENVNFFNTWPGAFFKSFVMLTGEFSIEDIHFGSDVSYVLFFVFVFIVSIVFFNLLNGLAVSDIQMIKNDAKLCGLVSLMKEISFHEDYLLTCSRIVGRVARCALRERASIDGVLKRIDIFPDYLPEKKIYILPNLGRRIITRLDRPDVACDVSLPRKLVKTIIEKAKKHKNGTSERRS